MTRHSKTILASLLALAATACATVGEDDLPGDDSDPGLGVTLFACLDPGCQEQGRTLLSAVLDADGYQSFPLEGHVSGTANPIPLSFGTTGLRLKNGGAVPTLMTLTSSNDAVVQILNITAPPGEPGPQYELLYTNGSFTGNPCVHGTAIAIDGDFDEFAHHDENTVGVAAADRRFSFACKDEGVAFKCDDWGYRPDSDPRSDGWKAHQVCTRAARADYCKNGTTHTLDETFVRIWDNYPGLGFDPVPGAFQALGQWPPPPGVYKFESVWPEDDTEPPVCLGKDRWQALEPGELDTCDKAPADPRTDPMAEFCEVMGRDAVPPRSIVFESKYTDLLLEEWQQGDDSAVTVTGYHDGGANYVRGKKPFGGIAAYDHVRTLGTLLRSLPGSIHQGEVIPVYTYSDGGADRVLAGLGGATWVPPFANPTVTAEGMVFTKAPESGIPATVALHAYQSDATGDYYNGVEPPADPDDVDQGIIGYILAPPE